VNPLDEQLFVYFRDDLLQKHDLKEAGKAVFNVYSSLVEAGFKEDQALYIVTELLKNTLS
jgi:hypothetical protein